VKCSYIVKINNLLSTSFGKIKKIYSIISRPKVVEPQRLNFFIDLSPETMVISVTHSISVEVIKEI